MFNLFKKSPIVNSKLSIINLNLSGLHCSSCAVNIDLSLEDLPGVISSKTNYAKSQAIITYDQEKIEPKTILAEIEKLGYKVK
jgi:copper chaperone CopZ